MLPMIDQRITKNMLAAAEILLARSAHWSRGTARTEDGRTVGVVAFSSSRQAKDGKPMVWLARCDGACCDCPGFAARQACSHALACRLDAERAREQVARKPLDAYNALIDTWLDDRTGTTSAY
jgi:hypothetical protein